MNWQKLQWKPLVAGFAATLVILLLGHYLWQRTAVERPLIQVLEQDEAVEKAEYLSDGKTSSVRVQVTQVARLGDAARRINEIVAKMQPTSKIEYIDKSNDYLLKLYDELHFAIYEASVTGNFTDLQKEFKSALELSEATAYHLEVDKNNIYVQLHQNDAYLYRVINVEVAR